MKIFVQLTFTLVFIFNLVDGQYVHVKDDFIGLVPPELYNFFSNLSTDQIRILREAATKHAGKSEAIDAEIRGQDPELAANSKSVFKAFSNKMKNLSLSSRGFISFVMQAIRSAEHVKEIETLKTIASHVILQWNRLDKDTKTELTTAFPSIVKTLKSATFSTFAKTIKTVV
ncbi:hypothetical protein M3Y98_01218800 [Aphelenchoides besseyi]|nr:hypothetical protein M3Y98_01218800 [Aphelenchoides besseyi]KAI6193317.1 hypothetical protein M3Y96_01005300 [Aphelenchoides besseyi]